MFGKQLRKSIQHLMLYSKNNHHPLQVFFIFRNGFGISIILRNIKHAIKQNQAYKKLGGDV